MAGDQIRAPRDGDSMKAGVQAYHGGRLPIYRRVNCDWYNQGCVYMKVCVCESLIMSFIYKTESQHKT